MANPLVSHIQLGETILDINDSNSVHIYENEYTDESVDSAESMQELYYNFKQRTAQTDVLTLSTYNILSQNYKRYPENMENSYLPGIYQAMLNLLKYGGNINSINECDFSKWLVTPDIFSKEMNSYITKQEIIALNSAGLVQGSAQISTLEPGPVVTRQLYTNQQGGNKQGYMACDYTFGGVPVRVITTHLSSTDDINALQVGELAGAIQALKTSHMFVVGDFNFNASDPRLQQLTATGLLNSNSVLPTYPSNGQIIDYILYTPTFTLQNVNTGFNELASDHAILQASFKFTT